MKTQATLRLILLLSAGSLLASCAAPLGRSGHGLHKAATPNAGIPPSWHHL